MEVYGDREFLMRYCFTKQTVRELLAYLPLQASGDNRGLPLTPMLQLLVALRFYGAGTFQTVSGDLINVSQPTVCRTVNSVTRLLAKHLFRVVVRFPDAPQLSAVMRDFYEIANFPSVWGGTGCIDCTRVRIKSPGGEDAEVYRNRKGVFSVNFQVSHFCSAIRQVYVELAVEILYFAFRTLFLSNDVSRVIITCNISWRDGSKCAQGSASLCDHRSVIAKKRKKERPPWGELVLIQCYCSVACCAYARIFIGHRKK